MNVLDDWLEESGWAANMASAIVMTERRADAVQSDSLTSRAQWAHQVTVAALFHLESQAFTTYKDNLVTDNMTAKPFDEWCADMESSHPQFFYRV